MMKPSLTLFRICIATVLKVLSLILLRWIGSLYDLMATEVDLHEKYPAMLVLLEGV